MVQFRSLYTLDWPAQEHVSARNRTRQLWLARPRSAGRLILTRRNAGERTHHLSTAALSGKAAPPEGHHHRNTPVRKIRDHINLAACPFESEWAGGVAKGHSEKEVQPCVCPLVFQGSAFTSITVRSNRSSRITPRRQRTCSMSGLFLRCSAVRARRWKWSRTTVPMLTIT